MIPKQLANKIANKIAYLTACAITYASSIANSKGRVDLLKDFDKTTDDLSLLLQEIGKKKRKK